MKLFYIFLVVFLCLNCQQNRTSSLVITNANIINVNKTQPSASALAISENKITFVGDNEGAKKYIDKDTKVLDLNGKTVIPGFIDAHAHFIGLGNALINIDLNSIKNWDEVVQLVQNAVQKANPGEWILGRGWHQEKWDKQPIPSVKGYQVHHSISEITPNNPVMLTHASGHAIFANAKAMEIAGIDQNTPNPDGGEIVKDKSGNPIGIFLETAESLVYSKYKSNLESLSEEEQKNLKLRKIQEASKHCLENGITSFHDAGTFFKDLDLYKELASEGKLDIRIWAMLSSDEVLTEEKLKKYRMIGFGNNFLTVRSIKQYVDGALGSRGAWLLKPYTDMSSTSGLNVTPLDHIQKTADLAYKYGYQLCTHAIGDRGNREMLDIYQNATKGDSEKRWRIEHAQHISKNDISRFAELGIIASMQTVHCISDGPWVPNRIGDERSEEGAYIWQKLLQSGAAIANGTDAPVEGLSPIENYYAAVTRRLNDGSQFYPKQILSREEALASLTLWNAYAAFEEDIKGSIEVGKLADLVVLSQDILTVPEAEILNTTIDYTIVDGKIKFERN